MAAKKAAKKRTTKKSGRAKTAKKVGKITRPKAAARCYVGKGKKNAPVKCTTFAHGSLKKRKAQKAKIVGRIERKPGMFYYVGKDGDIFETSRAALQKRKKK